jgi:hypothetical protein
VGAKHDTSGGGTGYYRITPPNPDARFDWYQIRIDPATREVFEVLAVKTITTEPGPKEAALTGEDRQSGKDRAMLWALDYLASLPDEELSNVEQSEFGTGQWTLWVSDSAYMSLTTNFAWSVDFSCKSNQRELLLARRVWPEVVSKPAAASTAVVNSTVSAAEGTPDPLLAEGKALKLKAYRGDPDAMFAFGVFLSQHAPTPHLRDKAIMAKWREVGSQYADFFWVDAAAIKGLVEAREAQCAQALDPNTNALRKAELVRWCSGR